MCLPHRGAGVSFSRRARKRNPAFNCFSPLPLWPALGHGGRGRGMGAAMRPGMTYLTVIRRPPLQRYIPVLFLRIAIALVVQHLQPVDQPRPRLMRLDDVVDVAPAG